MLTYELDTINENILTFFFFIDFYHFFVNRNVKAINYCTPKNKPINVAYISA